MISVKRLLSVICVAGSSMGLLLACTQTENLTKPAAVASDTVEVQATVIAVNRPEREVVLRGEDGTTMGYVLDENVRNFDQINVGDTVTAEYYEAVAIAVEPASESPGPRKPAPCSVPLSAPSLGRPRRASGKSPRPSWTSTS